MLCGGSPAAQLPEGHRAGHRHIQGVHPEDRALLEQALGTLEEQARRIVLLHAVTGLKHREIAQLLELPLATVLSKYHRALKKLKAQLEGDDVR